MIDISSPYTPLSQSLSDGELLSVALKSHGRTGNLANTMEHVGFQGDPLPSAVEKANMALLCVAVR